MTAGPGRPQPGAVIAGGVRAIATDLDGTLVRSDGTISSRTGEALAAAEAAGLLVVLVTGRPPRWLAPVMVDIDHRGIAICANGAVVYDMHTESVVSTRLLAPAQGREVVRRLRAELPGIAFAVEYGIEYGTDFGYEPAYMPRWPVPSNASRGTAEELLTQPAVKLLARHPSLDADRLLAHTEAAIGALATATHASSGDRLVEISAYGVTKATTLELFCRGHGIGPEHVVAFGDMPNDLPLLAWAGRGIAVANAHSAVLAAVTETTLSNDDDGVAVIVERIVAQVVARTAAT